MLAPTYAPPDYAPPEELLIHTKLHPPRLNQKIIQRSSLVQRLHNGTTCRLTLISAPAGYGKTTLMSAWMRESAHAIAWLSLDEGDGEMSVFLSYLATTMQRLDAEAGQRTESALINLASFSTEQIAQLVTKDLNTLDSETVLVFDDYHRLADDSPVHRLLTQLIEYLPEHVRFVIATRQDPKFPLLRLRVQGQLVELRATDLKFTLQEVQDLLNQSLQVAVPTHVSTALHQRTEGWPALVRLALFVMQQQAEHGISAEPIARDNGLVMEYLMEEALAGLSHDTQRFMQQISILERCTAALCSSATGLPEAACKQILMDLESRNIIIMAMESQGDWYSLHQLFRSLLRAQLHSRTERRDIATLHRRASTWFAQHGHLEEAVHHALAGDDVEGAVHLVEQYKHPLLNAERAADMGRLLSLLPNDLVEERPALLLARGWVLHLQGQHAEVCATVDLVERVLAQKNPGLDEPTRRALAGEVAALRSLISYRSLQGEQGVRYAQQAIEQLPEHYEYVRSVAVLYLGGNYQLTGHLKKAIQQLNGILGCAPSSAVTFHLRGLLAYSFMYVIAAELELAEHAAQHLLKLARAHGKTISIGWAHYLIGFVRYERNELDAAAQHLEAATELYPGIHMLTMHNSRFRQALVYQAQKRPEKATECLESLLGSNVSLYSTELFESLQSFRAHLALLQGKEAAALSWARTAHCTPSQEPLFFEVPTLTQARAFLAHGAPDSLVQAEAQLQACLDATLATHSVRHTMEALALQALVYARQARTNLALETLERSLRIGQRSGFIRTFVDLGSPMADLLSQLAQCDTLPQPLERYIHQLLAEFPSSMVDQCSTTEAASPARNAKLPEPLTEREVEVLHLLEKRYTNQEIARELVISPRTVKKHASNIYQKLGTSGRRSAVVQAKYLGILIPET